MCLLMIQVQGSDLGESRGLRLKVDGRTIKDLWGGHGIQLSRVWLSSRREEDRKDKDNYRSDKGDDGTDLCRLTQ